MPAKPVKPVKRPARLLIVLLSVLACSAMGGRRAFAASPPLLLLFPRSAVSTADGRALVKLRTRLRADQRLSVLTFDPESPSVALAAADAHHPEWLTDPVVSDAVRLDIARAIGAGFAAVIADAGRGKLDVHLLEAAPAARVRDYTSIPSDRAADAIERDAYAPSPAVVPPLASPAVVPPLASPAVVPPLASPAVVPPLASPAVVPPLASPAVVPPLASPAVVPPLASPALPSPPIPKTNLPISPALAASRAARNAADLADAQPMIAKGDQAVAAGAMVEAYGFYRSAINTAPLSDVPRLKLAQAYLLGGLPSKALDEAQRALQVVPNSVSAQEFLIKYDAENGTTTGAVARYKALVAKNPQDPTAYLDLGDSLWNGGDYAGAEEQYKIACSLAPADSLNRHIAYADLARLYAAMGLDSQCLSAMQSSGGLAYPLVLGVVQANADTLTAGIDTAHTDFDAGKVTRADFYAKVKEDGTKAQTLADFVAKITSPNAYVRSHLDRVQAITLLAQSAALLLNFIETSDPAQRDKAAQLEKDAQAEMLTAHAAEQKLGLWGDDAQAEKGP